jgi:hypothetical protein
MNAPWFSPNTIFRKELRIPTVEIRWNPPLQLSVQCSSQCTPKRPCRKPHEVTQQQRATEKKPAKWSVYQILSIIVVFVVLFIGSHSQKPQEIFELLGRVERYWELLYMTLYTFLHTLLHVLAQIVNKMGSEKLLWHILQLLRTIGEIMDVARQRPANYNRRMAFSTWFKRWSSEAIVEALLGMVFSVRSMRRLYNEGHLRLQESFLEIVQ